MTNEQKIKLADLVIRQVTESNTSAEKEMPVMVGTLTRKLGIRGFKTAMEGTPVFEMGDRYIIYLETINGDDSCAVKYYKHTLTPVIAFDASLNLSVLPDA